MTVPVNGRVTVSVAKPIRTPVGPPSRPWEATGSIEVEALAVWAYRDQKVDRFATSGLHGIEIAAAGFEPRGSTSDGTAAIARIGHMGCRVDVRAGLLRDNVHPAAEAVASLLEGIPGGDLVARHARHAGRPEGWSMPARRFRPVMWVEPGVEAQWERTDDGRGRFCPLISLGSDEEVAGRRLAYGIWWDALDQLAWRLSMRAVGFTVLPPTADRTPWAPAEAAA